MFKGFRDFVLRGNVVDLAVGVVIGAAFGTVVTAFVKDLLTPIIAAIVKKPDFSGYSFRIEWSEVSLWRLHQCHNLVPLDSLRQSITSWCCR
jgi:large conductance mechanosensitive channel protein